VAAEQFGLIYNQFMFNYSKKRCLSKGYLFGVFGIHSYNIEPLNHLMAKQIGIIKITGTIGGITFYKLYDDFYARAKSSLDGERVKKDRRFSRTMEEATALGNASKSASAIYQQLPAPQRGHGVHGRLTGRIRRLVRAGKSLKEAELELMRELGITPVAEIEQPVQAKPEQADFAEDVLQKVFGANARPCIQDPELQLMGNDASDASSRRYNPDRPEHAAREPSVYKKPQPLY
jgi:hypothetical protein